MKITYLGLKIILGGVIVGFPFLWKRVQDYIISKLRAKKKSGDKKKSENIIKQIEKLRNFYPHGRRELFITTSAIIRIFVYAGIQKFEIDTGKPFLISPEVSALLTIVFLLIYISIQELVGEKFKKNKLQTSGKICYFISAIFAFLFFIGFFTYSLSAFGNSCFYKEIKGTITINDKEEKVTDEVYIEISLEGKEPLIDYSNKSGDFSIFIKEDEYNKINNIRFILIKKGIKFSSTKLIEYMPRKKPWKIELESSRYWTEGLNEDIYNSSSFFEHSFL